jgi:hypothetical protein
MQCQRNKSRTTKPVGPLHPLPIPDGRGDSITIDFIGPLPVDEGFDCIVTITHAHLQTSTYTLELPNKPNRFPTFHSSQIRPFVENNNELFKSRKLAQPGPVLTSKGQEEWLIRDIIDEMN